MNEKNEINTKLHHIPNSGKKKNYYVKTLSPESKTSFCLCGCMHGLSTFTDILYMCVCMYIPMQAFGCSIQKADYCAQNKDEDKLLWI